MREVNITISGANGEVVVCSVSEETARSFVAIARGGEGVILLADNGWTELAIPAAEITSITYNFR